MVVVVDGHNNSTSVGGSYVGMVVNAEEEGHQKKKKQGEVKKTKNAC